MRVEKVEGQRARRPRESARVPRRAEPKRERRRPRGSPRGPGRTEAQRKEANERFLKRKVNLTLCCYEEVEGV